MLFGSLATFLAAYATWLLAKKMTKVWQQIIVLAPAVVFNSLIVGTYLPFLIPEVQASFAVILSFMSTIALSEIVVVYLIGWPLLYGLKKTRIIRLP